MLYLACINREVILISHKLLTHCPVCNKNITITKLACKNCTTKIEGDFLPCKFCRLPDEQIEFIEAFLKCRGNIKDVEKELGISYPSVRSRLDSVLQALGYLGNKEEYQHPAIRRQKIWDAIENGKITSEEAEKELRKT
ncbi:MAG: hypothetical protein H6Q73_3086 [Firmicutes bacterium]|nr:hypothetical protein [Bacillota bacterium]